MLSAQLRQSTKIEKQWLIMKNIEHGVISKVSDDASVAYIVSNALNRQYIFSYNKIVGYVGQSAKEIDLRTGRHVNFTLEDDVVQSVELL